MNQLNPSDLKQWKCEGQIGNSNTNTFYYRTPIMILKSQVNVQQMYSTQNTTMR